MKNSKTFITKSQEDLAEIAKNLIVELKYPIVLLIGDLGAGKTTLVKEILKQSGSEDSGSSPSYSLINEYRIKEDKFYHLDLYRLTSAQEAFALGLEDILYSGNRCIVEWPQLVQEYLEAPYCVINITVGMLEERTIELSYIDEE